MRINRYIKKRNIESKVVSPISIPRYFKNFVQYQNAKFWQLFKKTLSSSKINV